jgi:thiosulfate dehydrogenase [quinone] large subunit
MTFDKNKALAYLFLRASIGLSFFGHGLVRIPKLFVFRDWMVGSFAKSMLPEPITYAFATILPFAELLIGLLIISGWRIRIGLLSGAILVCTLIFGSCLIENWEAVSAQLIYAIILFVLLCFAAHNRYAFGSKISV